MKKYSVLIALAALAIFASCEKNPEGAREQTAADPVFTATIVNTKTTVNTSDGKVAWDGDEEITITDAASTSVVYEVSSVTDGRATFTKKAGESGSLGAARLLIELLGELVEGLGQLLRCGLDGGGVGALQGGLQRLIPGGPGKPLCMLSGLQMQLGIGKLNSEGKLGVVLKQ